MGIIKDALHSRNNPATTVERRSGRGFPNLLGRKERALPNVEVIIYFGPHGTERHMKSVQRLLREADIYVPENHGWRNNDLRIMNMISNGQLAPSKVSFRDSTFASASRTEAKAIYRSGKPVTFVDEKEGKRAKLIETINEHFTMLTAMVLNPSVKPARITFADIVSEKQKLLNEHGEYHGSREDSIVKEFTPAIRQVINDNPQLQGKETVKVLMSLGANHTRVSHLLRKMGYPVKRIFLTMPYIYAPMSEASRKVRFGKQVDTTMAARVILSDIIEHILINYKLDQNDFDKTNLLLRNIATQFSYVEIQTMVEEYWATNQDGNFMRYFPKKIFEEKGIRIPINVHEVDVFLGTATPRKTRKKRKK